MQFYIENRDKWQYINMKIYDVGIYICYFDNNKTYIMKLKLKFKKIKKIENALR